MKRVGRAALFGLVLFGVMGGMAWSQVGSLPGDLLVSEEDLDSEDELVADHELSSGDVSASEEDPLALKRRRKFRIRPLMHPDFETRREWIERWKKLRKVRLLQDIEDRLGTADAARDATSFSLRSYIQYDPAQRNQGGCGNCWAWSGTGIMEIANAFVNGVKDRFSMQYFNSCIPNVSPGYNACCGGWIGEFADLYDGLNLTVPWSNTNASFQDGSRPCDTNPSVISCGSIPTNPNYPITSIEAEQIPTIEEGQTQAINNIKDILLQNRGVEFAFGLGADEDWNDFFEFWDNDSESKLWNPDLYCGYSETYGQYGGHAVLIVGYNQTDADPAKHYWEVLNSWGTTPKRPNGIFRMPMRMNYDCYLIGPPPNDIYTYSTRIFSTLDVQFQAQTNLTPYKLSGWSDKIVVSDKTGTNTDTSNLSSTKTLYVDYAFINNGTKTITKSFYQRLYVDGVLKRQGHAENVEPNGTRSVKDFNIGKLSKGTHTIRLVVDANDDILESNEGDNEYTKTITVN